MALTESQSSSGPDESPDPSTRSQQEEELKAERMSGSAEGLQISSPPDYGSASTEETGERS